MRRETSWPGRMDHPQINGFVQRERYTPYNNYNKLKVIDVTGIFMMIFPLLVNWPGRVFEESKQYGGRSQN